MVAMVVDNIQTMSKATQLGQNVDQKVSGLGSGGFSGEVTIGLIRMHTENGFSKMAGKFDVGEDQLRSEDFVAHAVAVTCLLSCDCCWNRLVIRFTFTFINNALTCESETKLVGPTTTCLVPTAVSLSLPPPLTHLNYPRIYYLSSYFTYPIQVISFTFTFTNNLCESESCENFLFKFNSIIFRFFGSGSSCMLFEQGNYSEDSYRIEHFSTLSY
eukprot:sb/3470046/